MKICYVPRNFAHKTLVLIETANAIIDEYIDAGYILTLRQLYYQLVARDIIANTQKEYKRVGSIFNDARLSGLMSWTAIEDRTRNLKARTSWESPSEILRASAAGYFEDIWASQPTYIECWIEKEALAGVFEGACYDLRVPFFSCRGYVSQSEMWNAGMRLVRKAREGKEVIIIHFGDHDPSGMDMTRDIADRLVTYGALLDVERIALNMNQVDHYKPPPNPAKTTDSRYAGYIAEFGSKSWELDALEPQVLSDLVTSFVQERIDDDAWEEVTEREEAAQARLTKVADEWDGE